VAYLVVSSPDPLALREARFFLERLQSEHMGQGVLLVNRVRGPIDCSVPIATVLKQLADLNIDLGEGAAQRVAQAFDDQAAWAQLDAARLKDAAQLVPPNRLVTAPALRGDVHDLRGLIEFAVALLEPAS
jgi:anion-transporting  ArsA/GET3 family ATPase